MKRVNYIDIINSDYGDPRKNPARIRGHASAAARLGGPPPKHRKPVPIDLKKHHAADHDSQAKRIQWRPIISYTKALRFLATLSDYERLRIVRYNNDNFNLDRMRTAAQRNWAIRRTSSVRSTLPEPKARAALAP